jgi:two-component system, OmpR family, phosphate regulon sensor histidine kinase PhoR
MSSSIWWRITVPYVIILLLATLGLTLVLSGEVRTARLEDLSDRLLDGATLMSESLLTLSPEDVAQPAGVGGASQRLYTLDLSALALRWSGMLDQRITIIGADGTVLADSHANHLEMENHLFRPEIQQAIATHTGTAMRYSRTQRLDVMYAAVAIVENDELLGFVRVALPIEEIQQNVARLNRTMMVSGILAAVASAAIATALASRTIRPVTRLTDAVERMAAGDLSKRLMPTSNDEIGKLTRSFNHMADQLQEKVANLALERVRLSTVLERMADGVIITDESGTIVMINAAAARILRYEEEKAVGRRFPQVAYSYQLIDLWNRCYETQVEQSEIVETALYSDFVRAVVTPLRQEPPRYLVMLQDLTHIRRLETIRRDFISNISHELRTPLASLSLVVETLRDGALDDPPAAQRFLAHMETELASLTQMVEELLELSKIESGRVPLEIRPTKVRKLALKPTKRLIPQAERKGVAVQLSIPDDLPRVRADAARVQQVVSNLLHNAIKFTPPGGTITIAAQLPDHPSVVTRQAPAAANEPGRAGSRSMLDSRPQIIFSVADTGVGIPEQDVGRIFERFYKTDRARAQEGTGLGLAISRHIIEGHGGRIWAESVEGAGSTFYFSLPIAISPMEDVQASSDDEA